MKSVFCVSTMRLGKGDHKNIDGTEVPYVFINPRQLVSEFWDEVER